MVKISVLIAIYNSAQYLEDCLKSLLQQNYTNLQIICIDDASTDNSPNIIRSYAEKEKRIFPIFLTKNVGQAYARNIGLEKADGKYTVMLDSDDWFSSDALESAINVFRNYPDTDVVVFELCKWYNNTHFEMYPFATNKTVLKGEEAFFLSLNWKLHGLYMVRTDLHKRYPFDTSCRIYSDDNTTRMHYLHSRAVRFCTGIYYYRQRSDSATNKIGMNRFDYLEANLSMKKTLIKEKVSDHILNYYETQRWLNIVGLYWFWYQHRSNYTLQEYYNIRYKIAHLLQTIEKKRIDKKYRFKFGFIPTTSFSTFHYQEMIHFFFRHYYYKLNDKK